MSFGGAADIYSGSPVADYFDCGACARWVVYLRPRHQFIIVNKSIGFFFFQICFLEALSEGHYDFISFFFFSKYFHKIETSLLKLATFTGGTKNLLGFRPNDQQGESETSWPKRESKSFKCLLFKERKKNLSLGLFIVKRRNLLVVSISRITK